MVWKVSQKNVFMAWNSSIFKLPIVRIFWYYTWVSRQSDFKTFAWNLLRMATDRRQTGPKLQIQKLVLKLWNLFLKLPVVTKKGQCKLCAKNVSEHAPREDMCLHTPVLTLLKGQYLTTGDHWSNSFARNTIVDGQVCPPYKLHLDWKTPLTYQSNKYLKTAIVFIITNGLRFSILCDINL